MKRKLDTRTLGVLVGVALLLFAAGGYFLLVSPKKSAASRLDAEVVTATAELAAARSAAAAAAAPADTQPIAVADIFRLAKAMPGVPGHAGNPARAGSDLRGNGDQVHVDHPADFVDRRRLSVVADRRCLRRAFYALSDLLFRLRTLVSVRRGELHATGRLFAVQSVAFTESAQGFPNLSASLTVNAYVYGTDAPASDVPPPAEPPPAEETEAPPTNGEVAAVGATG